jgi:hypothetical protein
MRTHAGAEKETMFNFARLLAAGTALIAVSACAYDNPAYDVKEPARADRSFARGPDLANARSDEAQGEVAAQSGNWKMTLAFSERSYQQKPDLFNEFNLATAYQHTDNNALAIPLYLDLVERGQYTATASILNANGTMPPAMLRTISMESAKRLGVLGVDDGTILAWEGADQGFGRH